MRSCVWRLAAVVFVFLGANVASAGDPKQAFASVIVQDASGQQVGQGLVVTSEAGWYRVGHDKGYPASVCEGSSTNLTAVMLFSGYVVEHVLIGNQASFSVKKYSVTPLQPEVFKSSATCQTLLPEKNLVFEKEYKVDVGSTHKRFMLPDQGLVEFSVVQ